MFWIRHFVFGNLDIRFVISDPKNLSGNRFVKIKLDLRFMIDFCGFWPAVQRLNFDIKKKCPHLAKKSVASQENAPVRTFVIAMA